VTWDIGKSDLKDERRKRQILGKGRPKEKTRQEEKVDEPDGFLRHLTLKKN